MGDCMDWDICLQTLLFMYIQGYLGKINFLQILLERQTSKYCHSRVVGIMFLLHFFNRNFFFFLSNFLKRASTYLNQQCGKKLLTVYLHHFFFSRERTQKGKSGKKKNQKNYLTTDLSLIKNIGFCFCRRQKKQQLEKQQGEQSYQEGQAVQILIFILVYQ